MTGLPQALLWFHIATGGVALTAGLFTLFLTVKGSRRHVRAGLAFWYSMSAMALSGIVVAVLRPVAVFVLIGLLSLYLIHTGRNALTRSGGAVNRTTKIWFGVVITCLLAGTGLLPHSLARRDADQRLHRQECLRPAR